VAQDGNLQPGGATGSKGSSLSALGFHQAQWFGIGFGDIQRMPTACEPSCKRGNDRGNRSHACLGHGFDRRNRPKRLGNQPGEKSPERGGAASPLRARKAGH